MPQKFVRGGERPKPRRGQILAVRPYELHGTRYFALLYHFDDDSAGATREARLSQDMIYADPEPGDRVWIEAIMGVVDRMTKAT